MGSLVPCRNRRVLEALWVTVILSFGIHVRAETVDGFVTKIESPTDLYIGTLDVRMGGSRGQNCSKPAAHD
jgi:hypothetical protein